MSCTKFGGGEISGLKIVGAIKPGNLHVGLHSKA